MWTALNTPLEMMNVQLILAVTLRHWDYRDHRQHKTRFRVLNPVPDRMLTVVSFAIDALSYAVPTLSGLARYSFSRQKDPTRGRVKVILGHLTTRRFTQSRSSPSFKNRPNYCPVLAGFLVIGFLVCCVLDLMPQPFRLESVRGASTSLSSARLLLTVRRNHGQECGRPEHDRSYAQGNGIAGRPLVLQPPAEAARAEMSCTSLES